MANVWSKNMILQHFTEIIRQLIFLLNWNFSFYELCWPRPAVVLTCAWFYYRCVVLRHLPLQASHSGELPFLFFTSTAAPLRNKINKIIKIKHFLCTRKFTNFRLILLDTFFPEIWLFCGISFEHEKLVGKLHIQFYYSSTHMVVVTLTTEALRIGSGPCRLLWWARYPLTTVLEERSHQRSYLRARVPPPRIPRTRLPSAVSTLSSPCARCSPSCPLTNSRPRDDLGNTPRSRLCSGWSQSTIQNFQFKTNFHWYYLRVHYSHVEQWLIFLLFFLPLYIITHVSFSNVISSECRS